MVPSNGLKEICREVVEIYKDLQRLEFVFDARLCMMSILVTRGMCLVAPNRFFGLGFQAYLRFHC